MSDLQQQNHQRSRMPSTSDDEENSFVILSTCISGDNDEERFDSLPPIESMTLKDVQSLVNGEFSKINAQRQRDIDGSGSPMASLKSLDSHEDIQKKVRELICENDKLKSALHQNNLSMKSQKDKITLWQQEIENFCKAHKDKLTEAKETIEKLKDTNLKLSEEVAKYKDIKVLQDEEILTLKLQIKQRSLNDKLTDSSTENLNGIELEAANQKIQEQEIQICELQQKTNELDETNRKLNEKATKYDSFEDYRQLEQQKINELRVQMLEKMQTIETKEQTYQDKINELKMENARLREQQNNDDGLRDEINELKSKYDPNLVEKHEQLRLQLMSAQKTITDLKQELTKSNEQIQTITKELDDHKTKNVDEIFVLQQQLDIYKSDFDAERQAKSLLKDENRQMTDDLKNLQGRNQQLLEQVERLRLQSPVSTTSRPTAPAATVPPGSYSCPKCDLIFNNDRAFENHIIRCLELETID